MVSTSIRKLENFKQSPSSSVHVVVGGGRRVVFVEERSCGQIDNNNNDNDDDEDEVDDEDEDDISTGWLPRMPPAVGRFVHSLSSLTLKETRQHKCQFIQYNT